MSNILIADDNRQITSILTEYSKQEGFQPYVAYDGIETLDLFEQHEFEIILLDVMMPKKNGYDVCREIRQKSTVPIIMITARGEDFDKIMGLDIGADDYIVKPFSASEVMARIRAILRRIERTPDNESTHQLLRYGNLKISLDNFVVTIDGNELPLTKKEIELLWIMASNENKVFTRDNLLDSVWGYEYYGDNRTIDSHIKRLRTKLDLYEHPHWHIKTVWGMGYKFEVLLDEI